VASLSQGRTAAAQCGLFTHKSVPVIFEPPCIYLKMSHSRSRRQRALSKRFPSPGFEFGLRYLTPPPKASCVFYSNLIPYIHYSMERPVLRIRSP